MAAKKEEKLIEITPLNIQRVPITIVGTSPLVVHAWSEKAKQMMLDAQMKKTTTKAREAKSPVGDFMDSLYWLTERPAENTEEAFEAAVKAGAKFGFPVTAIKQAANSAAYRLKWVKNQMELRGSYFVRSEYDEFAEIIGAAPEMREDMVRVGNGAADIRYRGMFRDWKMNLELEYNASGGLTLEQIINCIAAGGYACGLGEWRPEKDGTMGMFTVEAGKKK